MNFLETSYPSVKNLKKQKTNAQFVFCFLLFIAFSTACRNDTGSAGKCKFGDPKPIFTDSMPTVKKHFFQLKTDAKAGKVGVEMVAFQNKLLLEIEQSGCNDIQQQFTFIMFGKFNDADDEVWKTLAIQQFRDLAKISPQLSPMNAWADAIESVKKNLKLSEPIEVQSNTHVRIDKILSADRATLVVQLSQN